MNGKKSLPIIGTKAKAIHLLQCGDIRGVIDLLESKGKTVDYTNFIYLRWENFDPWQATNEDIEIMKRDISYVRQRLDQIINRL